MEDMEAKLGAILGNPDMMAQIMSMAQQFGVSSQPPPAAPPPEESFSMPEGLDIGMLTKIAGMAGSARIDNNQQTLLRALTPYLAGERLTKLEKAMRAAKLAGIASNFLGSGLLSQLGR